MLGEYKVGRCTRVCHSQSRPLRDGEWYYSVVLESDEEFVRQDYSAESWTGPPENAIGWWKNRMPMSDEKKMVLAPPEVLIDMLRQMEAVPSRAKSRYLLALMLMRRKLVRSAPVETQELKRGLSANTTDSPSQRQDAAGGELSDGAEPDGTEEVLRVEVIADGSFIEVPVQMISRREAETLRDELNELLYCESDPVSDSEID
ncbi:MAG: hypothetical protein GY904_11585 [Planctomycetaceae bacterium]|nr:hypothetical protein [Planctomycetaceae bacterium]